MPRDQRKGVAFNVLMPPACPGDTYAPSYTRRTQPLLHVPGGGFAAAGNVEKRKFSCDRVCSLEREAPPHPEGTRPAASEVRNVEY